MGIQALPFANVLPADGRKLLPEAEDVRICLQPVSEISQKRCNKRARSPVGEMIVDPQSILLGIHKPSVFKDLEMLGYGRLSHLKRGLNLTDAQFLLLEHLHDLDAVRVREGLHDSHEIFHFYL
jgi:hypothetical protein